MLTRTTNTFNHQQTSRHTTTTSTISTLTHNTHHSASTRLGASSESIQTHHTRPLTRGHRALQHMDYVSHVAVTTSVRASHWWHKHIHNIPMHGLANSNTSCNRCVVHTANAQSPHNTHHKCTCQWGVLQTLKQACSQYIPEAQYAFKDLMIHGVLQFALRIAFCCVLHRCNSQDIHC